jgi:hypothetical protein
MSLSGSLRVALTGTISSARDLGTAAVTESLSHLVTVTDGATANKATQVWADSGTLATSGTVAVDLSGALTNGVGATVAFTRVIGFSVKASTSNGSTITLGGAASNAWETWAGAAGDTVKVRPGGSITILAPDVTGLAVATNADQLKLLNDSSVATAAYDIFIMGSEA